MTFLLVSQVEVIFSNLVKKSPAVTIQRNILTFQRTRVELNIGNETLLLLSTDIVVSYRILRYLREKYARTLS